MNEPLAHGPLIAILAMAAATYLTRISGYWLMGHIPMTRRVRRCLEVLPGAIMAATIVPIVAKVGPVALIAVAVALASMIAKTQRVHRGRARAGRRVARAGIWALVEHDLVRKPVPINPGQAFRDHAQRFQPSAMKTAIATCMAITIATAAG